MIELNEEQSEAAQIYTGIIIVESPPGGGKTRTLIGRISNLVQKHDVDPTQILGLTFTNNAAYTMKERLEPELKEQAQHVKLMTIHSFCLHLLKHSGRVFELLTGKEQIIFIKTILKRLRIRNISVGLVLREISLAKNNLINVAEFKILHAGDKTYDKIAQVYEEYESDKQKKLRYDFDDLLLEAYKLLSENTEIRQYYQKKFLHISQDEAQDANVVQMEILKLIAGNTDNGSSLFVVGDPDQSIYGFTGTRPDLMYDVQNLSSHVKQYILSLNYRSTPQILKACQNLIQHNEKRTEKEFRTENKDGDDVIIIESSSEEGEAINIVNEIKELLERGFKHSDIAILYRCNFQSRILEEYLSQNQMPYVIENGMNFYQRREVKILLDYLTVINNPLSDEGDESLLHVLNVPTRYLGRKFIKELEQYASEQNIYLYEGLKSMPITLPYQKKNVKDFIRLIEPLVKDVGKLEPAETLQILREVLDYDAFISEDDIPTPDDSKIDNINQLTLAGAKYNSIELFLQYVDTFKDVSATDTDGIKLMTIHKAKGLEFQVVMIPGLVEGIMPSNKGDIEEERRICFVGCSRAMTLLYLSWTHTYLNQPAKKSHFLDEITGDS
ncbi:ATP-dependent helicase [candidate division KSB1 bacterium]